MTIQRTYNQIKAHLLQVNNTIRSLVVLYKLCFLTKESLTYSNKLDDLEKQIEKSNEELKKQRIMNKDASYAKENVSNEFSKFEDKVYK